MRLAAIGTVVLLVALAIIAMLGPFRRPGTQGRRRPPQVVPAPAATAPPRALIQHQTESFIELQAGDLAGLTFHDAMCAAIIGHRWHHGCTAVGPDGVTYSFYAVIADSEHFVLHSGRVPVSATSPSGWRRPRGRMKAVVCPHLRDPHGTELSGVAGEPRPGFNALRDLGASGGFALPAWVARRHNQNQDAGAPAPAGPISRPGDSDTWSPGPVRARGIGSLCFRAARVGTAPQPNNGLSCPHRCCPHRCRPPVSTHGRQDSARVELLSAGLRKRGSDSPHEPVPRSFVRARRSPELNPGGSR